MRPKWSTTPLNAITRQHIEQWITELKTGTAPYAGKIKPRPLSPSSIAGIVRVAFGSPLRYAYTEGWITRNPLANIELPRDTDTQEMAFLTHEEIEALTGHMTHTDATLVRVLAYTGLRIGEATALTPISWRPAQHRLLVTQTWTTDRDGTPTLGTPKTWESRSVPVPSFLSTALSELATGPFIFEAPRGGPINIQNWRNRVWRKACQAEGIDGIRIHDLRHTAASIAITAGADVKLVQRMLGHKDATETLNTYGHLWPDRLDEVAAAITAHRAQALAS